MRRGQLKMGESFAVMVVFFILLAIGLIFYGSIKKSSLGEQAEETIDKQAIRLAQVASFLPELQCSFSDTIRENCFDLYKLQALANISQEPQIYLSYRMLFGNSRIVVEEVYPGEVDEHGDRIPKTWEIYDAALANQTNYTTKISTFIPLSLLNATVRPEAHAFGYLNVTIYG